MRRSMQMLRQGPGCHVGSAAVCLFESIVVTVFERQVPTLLVAGPLLLEILLSHHVQLGIGRQYCLRRRLLSRFQPDRIRRLLLRSSTVSGAMSLECSYPTHDERPEHRCSGRGGRTAALLCHLRRSSALGGAFGRAADAARQPAVSGFERRLRVRECGAKSEGREFHRPGGETHADVMKLHDISMSFSTSL